MSCYQQLWFDVRDLTAFDSEWGNNRIITREFGTFSLRQGQHRAIALVEAAVASHTLCSWEQVDLPVHTEVYLRALCFCTRGRISL